MGIGCTRCLSAAAAARPPRRPFGSSALLAPRWRRRRIATTSARCCERRDQKLAERSSRGEAESRRCVRVAVGGDAAVEHWRTHHEPPHRDFGEECGASRLPCLRSAVLPRPIFRRSLSPISRSDLPPTSRSPHSRRSLVRALSLLRAASGAPPLRELARARAVAAAAHASGRHHGARICPADTSMTRPIRPPTCARPRRVHATSTPGVPRLRPRGELPLHREPSSLHSCGWESQPRDADRRRSASDVALQR